MTRVRGPARLTTLPNLLGLARIVATPVVLVLLLLPFSGAGLLAFGVFAVAAVTDTLDGRIARARGQVSPLGVFMDLTADKVLVAGVLIAMVEVELLPTWIVAVILIRELVIAGVRQVAASEDVVMAAGRLGKWKTIVTLVAIAVLLLAYDARTDGPLAGLGLTDALLVVGFWLMVLAAAMTVLSGWAYLRAALPMLLGEDQAPPT
jgi:CDP-diacylglycerol--glycerol-3-phosphate 3-phosphatidyltransferase